MYKGECYFPVVSISHSEGYSAPDILLGFLRNSVLIESSHNLLFLPTLILEQKQHLKCTQFPSVPSNKYGRLPVPCAVFLYQFGDHALKMILPFPAKFFDPETFNLLFQSSSFFKILWLFVFGDIFYAMEKFCRLCQDVLERL